MHRYRYATAALDRVGEVENAELASFTERHKARLDPVFPDAQAPLPEPSAGFAGLVIEMASGIASRAALRIADRWIRAGARVFLYWPAESAVERLDEDRCRSYRWLGLANAAFRTSLPVLRRVRILRPWLIPSAPGPIQASTVTTDNWERIATQGLNEIASHPRPVPLKRLSRENGRWKATGRGAYLRTDYWARITSGGSYGHTCHVANELARASEGFTAFMGHGFPLLDEMGLDQVVVAPPYEESSEQAVMLANFHYYARLKAAFEALRPSYVYERLVLGNFAGARLVRELGIPYFIEYNGSEISMSRSFGGGGFEYEAQLLRIEEGAFRQATAISVISKHVKDSIVARGIPESKILVNPNGVDIETYAPATPGEKRAIREGLGFQDGDCVVGFIGTFGGWHGIDVLAAALPLVCAQAPNAKFLLIGDGAKKPIVDAALAQHRLWERVVCTGSVPQQEGARLLKACDLYVSPHDSHMVDSPFFGSPTKLFEYMGLAGGIVASDLEQIGEVLSPALRPADLEGRPQVTNQRAVLCRPGEVEEFAAAVVHLCANPELARALGANARKAAEEEYSWAHHVQRLLAFAAEQSGVAAAGPLVAEERRSRFATGDAYKDEVQNQWDNDPCGSHYVKVAQPHTLDWFAEAERYRYGEYGPWMAETMEFAGHAGEKVLEIGGGMGTDLAQFAKNGAIVTDLDLSSGHLALAKENFALRELEGTFVHHDAERIPFADGTFDVVYTNGVIHHTPNTQSVIGEIFRVLKPGGKAIVMVYAENSLHYWRNLVGWQGLVHGKLATRSIGDVMSETVELSEAGARPLVKVYTARRLRAMFAAFEDISIVKRQLIPVEVPRVLAWVPVETLGRHMGWNLVLKARKPRAL
ncbi:MAG: methyltransferase domain-containing protein [Betaproteobacteria bacterium]|nr:methyltransferase domain-containing protein [Betaproteobacteria bacterium]